MNQIFPSKPRQTVQALFPDGRAFEAPLNTTIEQFVRAAQVESGIKIVAALCDSKLRELSYPLTADARITPLTSADSDGARIYRRSLCFLMIAAAAEVLPETVIQIRHSMPFGGYYCETETDGPLTSAELARLRDRMRELVDADLPIRQVRVPLDDALALFRMQGDLEKAELFAKRRKDYLTLYEINGVRDYFHGFMVPSTGYMELFELRPYANGFILQFPRRQWPGELLPFEDESRLAGVFQNYQDWLSIMDVDTVTSLNSHIREGRGRGMILVAEALHQRQLAAIAHEIAHRDPHPRVVLISGPTSAGKTTFSRRLAIQLLAEGVFPVTIEMDNYFVNRNETPLDQDGNTDFEAFKALDSGLFRAHLGELLDGRTVQMPRYNFRTGLREPGAELAIGPDDVLLIEGIHGLNPALVAGLPDEAIYRVFISAFTQLNLDKHNRVPTTDTRLLRRIVRDAKHRGYSAADTIARWQSVRRGEKNHIFPYQNNADVFFNSALVYELSALKPLVEPLLLQVEADTPERIEANRLLAFLQWFEEIYGEDLDSVPGDSILREFTGGSILDTVSIWRR